MLPVNDPSFKDNLFVIASFEDPDIQDPEEFDNAQLKAVNGSLVHSNWTHNKIVSYYYGANFKDTEQLVEKTMAKFLDILHEDLYELNSAIGNGASEKEIIAHALKFKDDAAFATKLQKGSENIEKAFLKKKGGSDENVIHFSEFKEAFNLDALNYIKELDSKITDLMQKSEVFSVLAQDESLMDMERATSDLETFCKITNSESLTMSEAISLIKNGKNLYAKIIGSGCTPSKDPAESQIELASLSWYLMDLAIRKGQGHTQGAFMIEDPEKKLYQFLCDSPGYACGMRKSSHFKDRTPSDDSMASYFIKSSRQHGVDVVNEKLPADKRTILFEIVENAPFLKDAIPGFVLFFKLENFSAFLTTAGGYDALHHTAEWGASVYNKKMSPGSDDLPTMRKERIPSDMVKDFGKVIDFIEEHLDEFNKTAFAPKNIDEQQLLDLCQAKKNAKHWGIAYMYHFLEKVRSMPMTEANKVELHDLIDKLLDKITLLDNCDRRTGREVYLTAEELQKSS